jgi:hypothetical protein
VFLRVIDGGEEIVVAYGDASPEGTLAATPGSLYVNRTTGELFLKRAGNSAAGWLSLVGADGSGQLAVDLGLLTYTPQIAGSGVLAIGENTVEIPVSTNVTGGLITPAQHVKLSRLTVSGVINLDTMAAEVAAIRSLTGTDALDTDLSEALGTWLEGVPTVTDALQALFTSTAAIESAVDEITGDVANVDLVPVYAAINTLQETADLHGVQLTWLGDRLTAVEGGSSNGPGQFIVANVDALPNNADVGAVYVVVDATGDARVSQGAASYAWDGTEFVLFGKSGGGELTLTADFSGVTLTSGNDTVTLPLATPGIPGILSREDKFKLNSIRSFATRVGNGSDTVFDLAHNLNTRQLLVTVSADGPDGTGPRDIVYPIVQRFSNTVRVVFAIPPETNQYLVEVQTLSKATSAFVNS